MTSSSRSSSLSSPHLLLLLLLIISTTTTTTTMSTTPTAFRLENQVVCLTGASSGIGAAIAAALYAEGAKVVIGARRLEKLQEVAADIKSKYPNESSHPGRIVATTCDVTNRESVQALVQTACTEYQVTSVSTMVCCAGVMYFTQMKNALMDQWDQTMDVNCKGVMNCIGTVLPAMVEAKAGKIVTISSDAGVRKFPNLAVYCASKHFVETLHEITRRELVGTGVTLHTIQPGDVKGTELIMKNTDQEAADGMGVAIGQPVGTGFGRNQLLDPQDIANAVLMVLTAPSHVAINTIMVEPRDQE
jgi:NADP-dependent 3-hydroxy acid dehydrogenase YdfG